MRTFGHLVVLVTLWLLAWGEVSVANVLSGAAIATALLVAFPWRGTAGSDIRLSGIGMMRLGWYVVVQLVGSNIVMARQIVRPPSPTRPGVIAHHLEHPTAEVITVVSSIISLSPGTMTVDVAPDSSTIYVHFFHLDDLAAARRAIADLERLVIGAIASRAVAPRHIQEET